MYSEKQKNRLDFPVGYSSARDLGPRALPPGARAPQLFCSFSFSCFVSFGEIARDAPSGMAA